MTRPRTRWEFGSSLAAIAGSAVAIGLVLALGRATGPAADFVQFLGRFHPLAVHLPIGFVLLVAFAESLTLRRAMRERLDPSFALVLPPVLGASLVAFTLGLLAARHGGYPSKTVTLHWGFALATVVATSGCLVAWAEHQRRGSAPSRTLYRAILGLTVGLMSMTGHFGGALTHGEGYLTRYAPGFVRRMLGDSPPAAPAAAPPPASAVRDPLVYQDVLDPLLRARCLECHGPDKASGGLRVDDMAALRKGGGEGPGIVPGNKDASTIFVRTALPADADGHMPPEGRPGLTTDEVELVGWWIGAGASEALRVREALPPEGARRALTEAAAAAVSATPAAVAPVKPPPSADASADPAADESPASSAEEDSDSTPGAAAAAAASSGSAWNDLVAPVLAARCGRCHGAEKQKGKLRVDSLEGVLAGGRQGPAVVPGEPGRSSISTRMRLPLNDGDHMPPSDEPQPSAAEIELVDWWITRGANAEIPTSAVPAALRQAARATGGPSATTAASASTAAPIATAASTVASTAASTASTAQAGQAEAATRPSPSPGAEPPGAATATGLASAAASGLPARIWLYRDGVKPMLELRCGACHSGASASGGLDVADHSAMIEQGQLVPGDPAASSLLGRMLLPAEDPDHMPPSSMPQPASGELEAVRLWIAKGAGEELVVDRGELSADVANALWAITQAAAPEADAGAADEQAPGSPSRPTEGPPPVPPGGAAGCEPCSFASHRGSVAAAVASAGLVALALAGRRRARRRSRSPDRAR